MKYRKRPVVIEAVQWLPPEVWPDSYPTMDSRHEFNKSVMLVDEGIAQVSTIHKGQSVRIESGDFIIPEPDGIHFYPCKPDIFAKTYQPADEQSPDPGVAVLVEALKKIEIWTQFQIDEKTRTTINLLCKHVIASV